MFSFHKPKVYRSSTGCCICKAKSSSSRFTDSKKYEEDFLKCFQLSTPRQGEICNACVLLVKRWKKLPPGSIRNWKHVVDARAGPGMKSMTKFKSKNKKLFESMEKTKSKEFEREYSPEFSDKSDGNDDVDMGEDFLSEEGGSRGSSRTDSPRASDAEDNNDHSKGRRRKATAKKRVPNENDITDFVDDSYWRLEHVCCGMIFRGLNNETLIDKRYWSPCKARLAKCKIAQHSSSDIKPKSEASDSGSCETVVAKPTYCDSSSDSGYDESSNQGIGPHDSAFRKVHQLCIVEDSRRVLPKSN